MRPIAALAVLTIAVRAAGILRRSDKISGAAAWIALSLFLGSRVAYASVVELSIAPRDHLNLISMAAGASAATLLVAAVFRRRPRKAVGAKAAPPQPSADEARFRALFQAATVGIFIIDPAGNILEANDAFLQMIGLSREDVDRNGYPSWDQVTPPHLRAIDSLRLRQAVETGGGSLWRKEYALRNGGLASALTAAVHIASEPDHVICLSIDISSMSRTEQTLQTLSGRLLRLHDDERRRIARELHDTTAQNLAALSMNLTMLEQTPVAGDRSSGIIAECASVTEECLRQVRSLSYFLHPPLLDELGLGPALRAYLVAFTRRTGIQATLDFPKDFHRLDMDLESALFRIAQESLENVQQHSGTRQAEVRVAATPDGVELTVRDFGRGLAEETIAPNALAEGVGIAAMRERAREFSGRIEIGRANPGVIVRALFPGEHA